MTNEPESRSPADVDALLASVFAGVDDEADPAGDLLALLDEASGLHHDEGSVTFVSSGDPSLVGVRAAGLLEGSQIVAEAGGLTVVLDVSEAGVDDDESPLVDVRGEVLGSDEVLAIQLLAGSHEAALAVTDALGEFRLEPVRRGEYLLIVAGARTEVSIPLTLD